MASTNQSPEYQKAEQKYLNAQTPDEQICWLEEMIRECPKHKSAESMLANLKTRLKKLREKQEKNKKKSGGKHGIRKAELQVALVGFANSGKSSILKALTNANPLISEFPFTTQQPEIGMMSYDNVQVQIIDLPSLKNENFEIGLVNTTDVILIVINKIEEIKQIQEALFRAKGKQIIAFNKADTLDDNEKRKISETLRSKKYNFVLMSAKTKEGVEELKEKIFMSFNILRIYTKEPWKKPSTEPLIMKPGSIVKDVAEKIKNGLSEHIKETRVTGPSGKFPNQRVGLTHELKDGDIVEFKFD